MVLGHNLHYMAPFEIPRAAFCMVFRRASFVFSCQGTDFGAQDADFGSPGSDFGSPGQHFGPGTILAPQNGPEKNMFCGGMILWWGFRGIHPAQIDSKVPRTHMGRLLCPQTPLKIISRQIP